MANEQQQSDAQKELISEFREISAKLAELPADQTEKAERFQKLATEILTTYKEVETMHTNTRKIEARTRLHEAEAKIAKSEMSCSLSSY